MAAGGRRGLPESVNRCCSQTAQHVTEGEALSVAMKKSPLVAGLRSPVVAT